MPNKVAYTITNLNPVKLRKGRPGYRFHLTCQYDDETSVTFKGCLLGFNGTGAWVTPPFGFRGAVLIEWNDVLQQKIINAFTVAGYVDKLNHNVFEIEETTPLVL